MSKSVLMMVTPTNCKGCDLCGGTFHTHCKVNQRNIENPNARPQWCPLRPLPEKLKLTGIYNNEYFRSGGKQPSYKIGWNACIDEITGGNADD